MAVTLGADGVEVHRQGRPVAAVPAFPVEVVDTTGAGDAFSGALAWALASGESLDAAVELACAAAALSTRATRRPGRPAHRRRGPGAQPLPLTSPRFSSPSRPSMGSSAPHV